MVGDEDVLELGMGYWGRRRRDCEISRGEMNVKVRGGLGYSDVKLCLAPRSLIGGDSFVNG
jgi:hypothetical protein